MLGERTYSAQERVHLLLGDPLPRASVTFQTIYTGTDGGYRELAAQGGEKLGGVMDEDELEDFITDDSYSWRKSKWCKKCDKALCVYPGFPPNLKDDHYEDYCRPKVISYSQHPFRDLNILRDSDDHSLAKNFAQCQCRAGGHIQPKDTFRSWEEENREQEEDDKEEELLTRNPGIKEKEGAHWQALARLQPLANDSIPSYEVIDLGRRPIDDGWDTEASRENCNDINLLSSWIYEHKSGAQQHEFDPPVDITTLEDEQGAVLEEYVNAYKRILDDEAKEPPQLLLNVDGTAGCGKTYLIRAICQELRKLAAHHKKPNPILVLAPSGVAALNVFGRTIHSALSLPLNGFSELKVFDIRLRALRKQWTGVHFVIIDEKSMLGQRMLAMIDSRCRQIFPKWANTPFGNLNIALVGDFAQLPPVKDTPLYSPPSSAATKDGKLGRDGSVLYKLFTRSYRLQIVHRQLGDTPEQVRFRDLLRHVSQGGLSREEWVFLDSRNERKLSVDVRKQFDDATYLYSTRNVVNDLNLAELQALNQPCARINARHKGGHDAAEAPADEAGGLEPCVVLAKNAKIMITRNIWQCEGLVNATTGVVEDIIWAPGSSRSDLPIAVLVSCKTFKGPTLWRTEPRPDFPTGIPIVPVTPLTTTFELEGKTLSRTQLPLRLAWAVTIHKSQGLTLDRIRLGLGKKEFSTGLTFVALSRVKTFDGIMIVDRFDFSRVRKLGGKHLQSRFNDYAHRYPRNI